MCGRRIELTVDEGGTRLDKFLAERVTGLSRSAIRRLIDAAQVLVNGDLAKASYKVRPGDLVAVCVPQPEPEEPVAEAIPLGIVYEDQALIVVNKPAGMVIHPAPGHPERYAGQCSAGHCPDLAGDSGDARPGIVHRLDRDTSGLILVAKNEPIRRALQRQFKAARCTRCTWPCSTGIWRRRTGGSRRRWAATRAVASAWPSCPAAVKRSPSIAYWPVSPAATIPWSKPSPKRAHPPDPRPLCLDRPSGGRRHSLWAAPDAAARAAPISTRSAVGVHPPADRAASGV